MPRTYPHFHTTADAKTVGYSHLAREGYGWAVVFKTADGKKVEKMTRAEIRGKNPGQDFHDQAKALIDAAYNPPALFPTLERKGWDELLDEVEKTSPHTRSETIRSFRAAAKAFRETLPDCTSPLDVSEERVKRFGRLWLATPKANGKTRNPATLSYYMRALSAFTNHLIELGYVPKNLFRGVKVPKGEKRKKPVPQEAQVKQFFGWVKDRYPEWPTLHALLNLKAVSASRTADLCQLKTKQLRDGRLTFGADITKTKEERSLPLPPDLYATLTAGAGKTWLWEGEFFQHQVRFRQSKNKPITSFSWKSVKWTVENLFREFNESHPDQPPLTPHALRRRAITLTVQATGSVDAAALAIGINAQTAKAHYLDAKRAFDTDETMRKVADALSLG